MRFAIKLVQRAAIPESSTPHQKTLSLGPDRHRVRGVSLQLDGIRPGFFGGVHNALRLLKILLVVGGKLRDDVYRMAGADAALTDLEWRGHHSS